MNSLPAFPSAVIRYVRTVFATANRRVSEKIARLPNASEPSLDMSLIDAISMYGAPHIVAPGWAVRIDVHFLGGLRHYYRWEVADIGVLVFAKQNGSVVASKAALLQSKRLYPKMGGIVEEALEDYKIGFQGLMPSPQSSQSLLLNHEYKFTKESRYKALKVDDDQFKVIEKYESSEKLDIFYLLYNPWILDSTYSLPLTQPSKLGRAGNGSCRVVPSKTLRTALKSKDAGYAPTFSDVESATATLTNGPAGWRLEHFVADQLLRCKQGNLFASADQRLCCTKRAAACS
jgi:hypothetical protein